MGKMLFTLSFMLLLIVLCCGLEAKLVILIVGVSFARSFAL